MFGGSLLQDPTTVDEDIASVFEFRTVWATDTDFPNTIVGIPIRGHDSMLQLHILDQAVLIGRVFEVLPYLRRLGIILRPVGISSPGELITCGRYVASAARIS